METTIIKELLKWCTVLFHEIWTFHCSGRAFYIIQWTDSCGAMTEDLDVAKVPPVMRHIIRELLELAGLNLWSQQASAAQGYNVLCSKWASLLWEVYFWTLQSVWVPCADCTMERYRRGLRESINQMWIHTLDTCATLKPGCHPAELSPSSCSWGQATGLNFHTSIITVSFYYYHYKIIYFHLFVLYFSLSYRL